MREYKRVLLLVLIMTAVAVSIGGFAVLILYETAIGEERQRLVDAATSQARLIEAIARQEQTVHRSADEARAAALSQVLDSLAALGRSSRRAEFLLGERRGDEIVSLPLDRPEGESRAGAVRLRCGGTDAPGAFRGVRVDDRARSPGRDGARGVRAGGAARFGLGPRDGSGRGQGADSSGRHLPWARWDW